MMAITEQLFFQVSGAADKLRLDQGLQYDLHQALLRDIFCQWQIDPNSTGTTGLMLGCDFVV